MSGGSLNPFGKLQRLDQLELEGPSVIGDKIIDVISNISPVRNILLESFKDALNNYLFYGLGNNGTCANEFWSAIEFLFNVRSYWPETWNKDREIIDTYYEGGKLVEKKTVLSDKQLKLMCIDVMWEVLEFPVSLPVFIEKIKQQRRKIINDNWEQVKEYLSLLYNKARVKEIIISPFILFTDNEIKDLLVEAKDPYKLVKVISYRKYEKENPSIKIIFEENLYQLKPILNDLFNFNFLAEN